jgi:hypothetical protein
MIWSENLLKYREAASVERFSVGVVPLGIIDLCQAVEGKCGSPVLFSSQRNGLIKIRYCPFFLANAR